MIKLISFVLIGIVTLAGIGYVIRQRGQTANTDISSKTDKPVDGQKSFGLAICDEVPKSIIGQVIGKPIEVTENTPSGSGCMYYTNKAKLEHILIQVSNLSADTQKKGQQALDRTITTNNEIPMDHFIATQEDGQINAIYLVMTPDKFVRVDRTANTADNDQLIALAAKLSEIVTGVVPLANTEASNKPSERTVPLPQEEDIVRNFFALIEEKKPADAVSMMSGEVTRDDSRKQAWAVQFNAISSMKVIKIEPSMPETWTGSTHSYKLTLDVKMNPDSANAQIPYFGWENGQNFRWVTLVREDNLWKIQGIATGP